VDPPGAFGFSSIFGDNALGIALDASRSVYVAGRTSSSDFPVTPGAFDTTHNPFERDNVRDDAFVAKLDASGMLVYGTYLGGVFSDWATAVAVDANGNAYVSGVTDSNEFPVVNAFQPFRNGAPDAFAAKLSADGSTLLYSTRLGGSSFDFGNGIGVDGAGMMYAMGATFSAGAPFPESFPTRNALQPANNGSLDVFVAKIDPSQVGDPSLLYSTYIGGSAADEGLDMAVDAAGNTYVTGHTGSPDFPTVDALQAHAGDRDVFIFQLNPTGSSLVLSTFLGRPATDVGQAVAPSGGDIYVAGYTSSLDFPLVNPAQPAFGGGTLDAFVAKISSPCVPPPPGMVSWWPLDGTDAEVAGSMAEDETGSNHGTLAGGAAFIPGGRVAGALSLDGFSGYVRVPDHDSLDTPDGFTVDAWIYPRSHGGARDIASKWDDPTGQWSWIFKLHNDGSGRLRIEVSRGDHNALGDLGGVMVLPLNAWSHVAATYDRAASRLRLYVNGALDAEGSARFPQTAINNSATDILIGAVNGQVTSPVEHFDGLIDELELFNRELAPEEIQSLFAAGSAGKCRNQPPVADAGDDQMVECTSASATPVMLDGSGSSDSDGDDLTYTWTGPFPEGGGTATGVSPTVTLPLGTSTITLVVNDGTVDSEPDTIDVTVKVAVVGLQPPLLPLVPEGDAVPLPDKAFKRGRTLPLKLELFCGSTELTDADVAAPVIAGLVRDGDALDVETLDLDSGTANDSGLAFRYSDGNWVYNLSTSGLSAGTYTLTIEMPDGLRYSAAFVLR
ncbi:MAG: LamG-like jellyroll fold domain-containing protein, partial [Candidatus Acidiferrales bacterium]